MDKVMRSLVSENFYATTDTLRSFFMLGMENMADSGIVAEKKKTISEYGSDTATIFIEGIMLRERNWYTENGFATSTEEVIDEIKKARAEGKRVKLMMNTGGGLVSGTSNLANLVYQEREYIDAYATGMVASAGMWVFSSAGNRYAEDTTLLGSIGVVTTVFDDEKYWESYGIVWKEIVSENAKNKRPDVKTESGLAETKRYITDLEAIFIDSVSNALGMSKEEVISNFKQGGIITGKDALDIGAISGIINANSKNKEKVSMEKDVAKLENELAEANDSIGSLNKSLEEKAAENAELKSENEKLKADFEELKSKTDSAISIEDAKEVIGAAFEYNVGKDDAISMIETKDVAGALKIALKASKSEGASEQGDLESTEGKEQSEKELAHAIAARNSVRKK